MVAAIDMTGASFNGIRVVAPAGSAAGKRLWQCECSCGSLFVAVGTRLRDGSVSGCARCAKRNMEHRTHGATGSREYVSYCAMKQRCLYPKNKRYEQYGGRGIRICDRWLESFENFYADMGQQPGPGYSIERIDRDKDYEPGNCVWADSLQQANNRSNNTRIEINGRTQTMTQWSRETGVNRTVILRRMKRGLSGESLIAKGATS